MNTNTGSKNSQIAKWQRKLAAVGEVLAVLVVGNVLARLISNIIGFAGSKQQLNQALINGTEPNFLQMAWLTAGDLLIKYGILCGLAFFIGWWHRRRPIKDYGLSLGGNSVKYLSKGTVPASVRMLSIIFYGNKRIPRHLFFEKAKFGNEKNLARCN